MAIEVTVVLRFEDPAAVPDRDDLEYEYDCIVIDYEEEEV